MMPIRRVPILLLVCVALGGCLPAPATAPAMAPAAATQAGTQGLPPARTRTPSPEPSPTLLPSPILTLEDQTLGLLPAFADDVQRLGELTRYAIEVRVSLAADGKSARLEGTCQIQFSHAEALPLQELVLMLWPNDPQYEAAMSVAGIQVDGRSAAFTQDPAGIALRVSLPRPLETGRVVELFVPFEINAGSFTGFSPRRFGVTEGVLIAPTFYPLIPPRVDGQWQVEAAPPGGDTTNSDTAYYQLVVEADPALSVVASGVELADTAIDGSVQRLSFVSGPMRDLAIAVGPLQEHTSVVGDVVLRAWLFAEHADQADALLDAAGAQLGLLGELVGPYRYPELDLVDSPGAFGGIEYPGLVYLGTIGSSWMIEPAVHEVAHQWFYGLIGDDQLLQPWLDEAAATYMTALYYEFEIGRGEGTGYLSNLRALVRDQPDPDLPIGLPVGDYATENEYAVFVYFKGALFFDALRNRLGESAFEAFLHSYYSEELYRIASAADFQAAAEQACSCNLDGLFNLWVYKGGAVLELES